MTDAEIQQFCDGISVCTSCYKKIRRVEEYFAKQTVDKDELLKLCKKFIEDNQISCSESIWQTEWVSENALALIKTIAEIVGYHEDEHISHKDAQDGK
jgi:hypothetical protein